MIPKDIQEQAKTDPLVAEILVLGGPYFYKEYQQIRQGRAEEMVRSRAKKAFWGAWVFGIIAASYIVMFLFGMRYSSPTADLIDTIIKTLMVGFYAGMVWVLIRNKNALQALAARIENGEFSKEAAIEA